MQGSMRVCKLLIDWEAPTDYKDDVRSARKFRLTNSPWVSHMCPRVANTVYAKKLLMIAHPICIRLGVFQCYPISWVIYAANRH